MVECTAKALITGGSGVLGRHVAEALLARGTPVRILDLRAPPAGLASRVEFVRGDITDSSVVEGACTGCAVVFHLAGRMPQARLGEQGFYRVNVQGTRCVAEACVKRGVPVCVFASTIEIYGPQKAFPITEEAATLFTGAYSRTKWQCEKMLLEYRSRHGLKVALLRMPLILGPGFYHEKAVLEMMRRVRQGRVLPLPGGPEIPFIAVAASDAAEAFIRAWQNERADGQVFNIAAGRAEPSRRFFSAFIEAVGSRSRIVPIPRWVIAPLVSVAMRLDAPLPFVGTPAELLPFALTGGDYDISKARSLLGYCPEKDCLAALIETYRWALEEGVI